MKYLKNMNENEIHEGICGSHQGARTLAKRVLRDGFDWLAYFASRSVIFSESQFEKVPVPQSYDSQTSDNLDEYSEPMAVAFEPGEFAFVLKQGNLMKVIELTYYL